MQRLGMAEEGARSEKQQKEMLHLRLLASEADHTKTHRQLEDALSRLAAAQSALDHGTPAAQSARATSEVPAPGPAAPAPTANLEQLLQERRDLQDRVAALEAEVQCDVGACSPHMGSCQLAYP